MLASRPPDQLEMMLTRAIRAVKNVSKWKWLAIAVLAIVVSVFVDHWWPLYGGPVGGVVLAATTSEPIPNAFVIVKWRGSVGGGIVHGPRYVCYHVAVARTDSDGKFYVPAWFHDVIFGQGPDWLASVNALSMAQPVEFTAYKSGYAATNQYPVARGEDISIKLEPFQGTTLQRLGYLAVELDEKLLACDADDKTQIPIYQTAYEEGLKIARSPEELKLVDSLLVVLESAQFGNDVALDRKAQRRLQRIRAEQSEQTK